ncbi:MAG: CocE/NonD family hydrolase [Acetobacteraceae bacterium]|nr:CocE/NonD family hydrolase [Acetobacteraceae bacterium]
MSDADEGSAAWRVTPSNYLRSRPAEYAVGAPHSRYLTMDDGCRLAVDVYLPAEPKGRLPTMLILTPYYRRFALATGAPPGTEPTPNVARWRDLFVPRGYALVVADVRGTGASFGTRDAFRSPRERQDYAAIADWIIAEPWSDGTIGATGISYVGAACDFLASTGHKAVRAIAPLFAVWDTYADHYYPGGLLLNRLAQNYDALMVALDQDRRDLLGQFAYFKDPYLRGPQPVDDDRQGSERDVALRAHAGNFRMPDFITEFRFREEALAYDPDFSSASFSPYHYAADVPADIAVLSLSGWMDGAGYANGALARFLTLPNEHRHLVLGPWDHGARINASPWRDDPTPRFALGGEILRFFDHYLTGRPTGLEKESPVHYFSLHDEAWHEARAWPPLPVGKHFHPAANALLAEHEEAGVDDHQVDFAIGTGCNTRYERIAGFDTRAYYVDWQGRDARMLSWTSAPLGQAAMVAGHAVLTMRLAADRKDCAIHAYLSEVEADGTVRYVTEGMLRALHRKEQDPPSSYRATWPWRSYARADAAPLPPGEPVTMRLPLLPTAWRFSKGSRIRLSITGADADHFGQVPHGSPPRFSVHRDGTMLALPWREGD